MIPVIREEDLLSLQTAVLDAALARTAPGEKFLSFSEFKQMIGPGFDEESLAEMLRELAGEGILQLGSMAGVENQYCVTKEYVLAVSDRG